ncbi:hypothetical protein JCM17845_04080 [Iodidimonas gelatinilytica]|uniref:Calx-beta domain-containing protein n=2 Tax=Iodidimonas gelatinilytica TaxID=1236966 RepID=A0A5A7MWD2_9PROT|nr:hypothetical protein JCM17845_04080 [Iodidimonas gelatinilytica]
MKTLNKLALSSAVVALMAGTAYADAELTVGTANGDVGELGTPINLAAGSNFLQQNGTVELLVGEGATADFGIGGNASTLTFTLTGTGFVLNGAPAMVDRGTCTNAAIAPNVTGGIGDASFTIDVNNTFEANCGDAGNELSVTVPVILTDTSLGNSASASVSIAATAAPTVVIASDDLDDPIVDVVEPFEAAVTAGTNPVLSLDVDPSFSAFNDTAPNPPKADADLGTVNVSQFGGAAVIAIAAETAVANPAAITVTVTVEDATGIDNFTLDAPAATLAQTAEGANTFSVELTGADVGAFLGGDRTITANLLEDEDAAMVSAQAISVSVTSVDGDDAEIGSASTSGALASFDRDGTNSTSFEWVALEAANLNNIFRFTNLADDAQVFATITNLNSVDANDSNRINDFDLTAAGLTSGTSAGGELQITAVELGDALSDAGLLDLDAVSITRGAVQFTVEQNGVAVNRLMFNADGAVNSTGEFDNRPNPS